MPRDLDAVKREFRERLRARRDNASVFTALHLRFGGRLRSARTEARGESFKWKGVTARAYLVRSRSDIRLPTVVLFPEQKTDEATVVVSRRGKASLLQAHGAFVRELLERGKTVVVVDIRYGGELDRANSWREPYGKVFGRDPGIVAADDIAHALRAVSGLLELKPTALSLVAFGEFGASALYAMAIHGGCGTLVIPDLGPTYESVDRQPKIAGILRVGDLPAAAALLPKTVRLVAGGCPFPIQSQDVQAARLDLERIIDALTR